MRGAKRWDVEIFIGEEDGRTYAEARLHTDIGDSIVGVGRAQVSREDYDVPEIGDELAVARAVTDLGHRLLYTAVRDIEQVTGEHHIALTR
jgi:hypothetical protein